MNHDDLQEIIDVLPRGKTLFHYFKDRYALLLLEEATRERASIADLRRSRFGKLLDRPIVKPLLGAAGAGAIAGWDFASVWPSDPECYLLTLGRWGEGRKHRWEPYWHQTTRPGLNLVLQLNFSSRHDLHYAALIGDQNARPFEYTGHPIAERGLHTLAWARLDIDMENGQALIEEIQSDWVRRAVWYDAQRKSKVARVPSAADGDISIRGVSFKARKLERYVRHVLATHIETWDEAILSAAVWFLTREIGVRDIFMHEFNSGNLIKELRHRQPPRSLYTSLPRRFCFELTRVGPRLLGDRSGRQLRRWVREDRIRFWRLTL